MLAVLTVSHGTSDPAGRRAIERLADAVHRRVPATHVGTRSWMSRSRMWERRSLPFLPEPTW